VGFPFDQKKISLEKIIMPDIKIYTIGVYGFTKEQFFNKLKENKIDTFCDIRNRRGVRGSEYSFANSKRLQDSLSEMNINYIHILDLSTPDGIRKLQYKADKESGTTQRKRESLSGEFISVYRKEVLKKFDFQDLLDKFNSLNSKRVVFFCVEKNPSACHRSVVSDYLHQKYRFRVNHL
jgi:uncharacterized protein (DUF488 family)